MLSSRTKKWQRDTDKWDVTLSHRDPLSGGGLVSTHHTVEAKMRKKARRRATS